MRPNEEPTNPSTSEAKQKYASHEAKFTSTFNQAAVGMAHVGLDGTFLLLNQKFCDIAGYSSEELMKLGFQHITHPEDLEADLNFVRQLLSGKIQTYSMEKRYITKEKKTVWVNLTGSLVRSTRQEPLFFIAVIEDICQRKKVEHELAVLQVQLEEKVKLRTAELEKTAGLLRQEISIRHDAEVERNRFFTISRDAMIVLEHDGRFRRFNPAFANILGYSEDELAKVPIHTLIHPEDLPAVAKAEDELNETNLLSNFESRYLKKDGTAVHLSWTASRFVEQNLVYAIARDITESKRIETLRNEERVKALGASKMNALGRMAAGIAHEINNPLTVVYGNAFRLRRFADEGTISTENVRKIAGQIEKMSLRIVSIISGLRTFAREGSSDPFEFVKLQSIVDDTLSFCQRKIESEEIRVTLPQAPSLVEIHCRSVQISQVLLNLLNNACDAVEQNKNKEIAIEFIETEDHVGLAVRDNGVGLSSEEKDRLFEPFFTTKEVGKGTGLGLSVSKGIVKSHDGRLYLDESCSQTRFVFLLPRVF